MEISQPIFSWIKEHLNITTIILLLIGSLLGWAVPVLIQAILNITKPKPEIVINFTEISRLGFGLGQPIKEINGKKPHLLFGTESNNAIITLAYLGDTELNKKFGYTLVPYKLFANDNQTEYNLIFKNIGKKLAKDVVIYIQSISKITTLEHDPALVINCDSILQNDCVIHIPNFPKEKEYVLNLIADNPGIRKINATIDGEPENIKTNLRHFIVSNYIPGLKMALGDKEVSFPPINKENTPKSFYYKEKTMEWVPIESAQIP